MFRQIFKIGLRARATFAHTSVDHVGDAGFVEARDFGLVPGNPKRMEQVCVLREAHLTEPLLYAALTSCLFPRQLCGFPRLSLFRQSLSQLPCGRFRGRRRCLCLLDEEAAFIRQVLGRCRVWGCSLGRPAVPRVSNNRCLCVCVCVCVCVRARARARASI